MKIVDVLFNYLIFPGLIFSAALGLVSSWVDRKITARVQWRVGPPWYQPVADILKLLGKETVIPEGASVPLFLLSPIAGLAGAVLVSTMLWALNIDVRSTFIGDLIVILYLLILPSLAIILGGFSSGNPLASTGGSREMKLILAYELPFIIAVFTVVAKTGTIIVGNIIMFQQANGMLLLSPSCAIAALVSLIVAQAKLGFVPFDAPEAEQELAGGALVEYSGALLAIFRLTKAVLLAALPVFLITLFLGGIDVSTISGIGYFALKYVLVLLLITVIRNTNPRLRVDQAVRFFWGPVTILAILGFVLAMFGA